MGSLSHIRVTGWLIRSHCLLELLLLRSGIVIYFLISKLVGVQWNEVEQIFPWLSSVKVCRPLVHRLPVWVQGDKEPLFCRMGCPKVWDIQNELLFCKHSVEALNSVCWRIWLKSQSHLFGYHLWTGVHIWIPGCHMMEGGICCLGATWLGFWESRNQVSFKREEEKKKASRFHCILIRGKFFIEANKILDTGLGNETWVSLLKSCWSLSFVWYYLLSTKFSGKSVIYKVSWIDVTDTNFRFNVR